MKVWDGFKALTLYTFSGCVQHLSGNLITNISHWSLYVTAQLKKGFPTQHLWVLTTYYDHCPHSTDVETEAEREREREILWLFKAKAPTEPDLLCPNFVGAGSSLKYKP